MNTILVLEVQKKKKSNFRSQMLNQKPYFTMKIYYNNNFSKVYLFSDDAATERLKLWGVGESNHPRKWNVYFLFSNESVA